MDILCPILVKNQALCLRFETCAGPCWTAWAWAGHGPVPGPVAGHGAWTGVGWVDCGLWWGWRGVWLGEVGGVGELGWAGGEWLVV